MAMLLFDIKNDNIHIFHISVKNPKRLTQTLNFEGIGLSYKKITCSYENRNDFEIKGCLDELICNRPNIFVFFNEHKPWLDYLLPRLKKTGTEIYLAPDGTAAYFEHYSLKNKISGFINGSRYLLSNGFHAMARFRGTWYGYHKEIDYIVIEDEDAFINHNHKKLCILQIPNEHQSKKINGLVAKIFGFDNEIVKIGEGSILWLDQPEELLVKQKLEFLKELHATFPGRKIFVKPHPHSYQQEIMSYEKEVGASTIRANYPAELIMGTLSNVVIISICTTAMFYNNPSCRYYWIYPMFQDVTGFNPPNLPFNHINRIKNVNEIIFPSE